MIIITLLLVALPIILYMLILLYYKKNLSNKSNIIENSLLLLILLIFLMIISGLFRPVVKEEPFLGEGIYPTQLNYPDYTLQGIGYIIFWSSIILFLTTTICLSNKRRKSIIKWGIIGLFSSIFLFGILSIFVNNFTSFLGRLIFVWLFNYSRNMGDGGIILIFLVPFYGLIAGSLIGFIISSLNENKRFYQKSGFYLALGLSILMLISAFMPVKSFNSFNDSSIPYYRAICSIQGCNLMDASKLCEKSELEYPRTPINQLPNEIMYTCDSFDYKSKPLTKEELVEGKCPHLINGETIYLEPLIHPLYAGYYLKDNKIYIQGKLCGDVGKIRYVARCSC